MDFSNRLSIFIALGCLLFVLYDTYKPHKLSEVEQAQIQAIVENALNGHVSSFSSRLETEADRVLRQNVTDHSLETKKSNVKELVLVGVRIASDAQAWKRKPVQFGGGSKQTGFNGLTLEQLGYPTDKGGRYTSTNGVCEIKVEEVSQHLQIFCANKPLGNVVRVKLSGMHVDDMTTRIFNVNPSLED